ncbi:MAG: hypothetical protein GY940_28885 [bacterium]|nr:hypothetical protein [bacterium]
MVYEPELHAMSLVFEALKDLDNGQRRRIINWVSDRLKSPGTNESVQTAATGKDPHTPGKITKKKEDAPAKPKKKDISDFDTVLDLFAESEVKKSTAKVLLMAAYLQERHSYKEISSYDINFRLKRIGYKVTNISSLINGLLNRKPHLLVQVGAEEHQKRGRRKYQVTKEGLKIARGYLKSSP